jgi:hypothetical protein
MAYAEGTEVAVYKSRLEIETLLHKHKASSIAVGFDGATGLAIVMCELSGRRLRFLMRQLDRAAFRKDHRGYLRSELNITKAFEGEERRTWRALLLTIKAKFESVESRIETFDEAFLANVVLPDGRTVAEVAVPQIVESYKTGRVAGPLLQIGMGSPA